MESLRILLSKITLLSIALLIPFMLYSQTDASLNTSKDSIFSFDIDIALFFIALTLAFIILVLIKVLRSAIRFHFNSNNSTNTTKIILIGIIILSGIQSATAQSAAGSGNNEAHFLLSTQGWFLLVIIALELYAIASLTKWIKFYTGIEAYESQIARKKVDLWKTLNAATPIELENSVDTGHDYDGIRELDNVIPPWFTATFVVTILFAAIYMYRYHIAGSAPTQIEEYKTEMKNAELRQLEYLKHEANLIDENTVTMMNEGQYEEGKSIYKTACAVCHGNAGEGLVGPNMTDDYWIHGGSIKDIFKVIKYGVIDKGMKPWKDDYSPNQIAQLSSYIKSMRGTNPPNPKEPQGELYKEAVTIPAPKDNPVADSLNHLTK